MTSSQIRGNPDFWLTLPLFEADFLEGGSMGRYSLDLHQDFQFLQVQLLLKSEPIGNPPTRHCTSCKDPTCRLTVLRAASVSSWSKSLSLSFLCSWNTTLSQTESAKFSGWKSLWKKWFASWLSSVFVCFNIFILSIYFQKLSTISKKL